MKGLIVYCLDRIIRRGCRSCLHWYLSVLSRLIDTLDCYISKLKTFSAGFHSRFYFFFSPLRLVIKKFGRASWQFSLRKARFYLAPPGVYSKSSDKSHKTWTTLRLLILMMKVHHQPLRVLWAQSDVKLNCNQSCTCKHCPPFFPNTFISEIADEGFILYASPVCGETTPSASATHTHTHTFTNSQCVIIMMKYATRD